MISRSNLGPMTPTELADYGFAVVKDLAFDSVNALWRRRQNEGLKQADLAKTLDWDEGRLSRCLSGPGNWTFRTYGALIVALNGEPEIKAHALEDAGDGQNYDAYDGYRPQPSWQIITYKPLVGTI